MIVSSEVYETDSRAGSNGISLCSLELVLESRGCLLILVDKTNENPMQKLRESCLSRMNQGTDLVSFREVYKIERKDSPACVDTVLREPRCQNLKSV